MVKIIGRSRERVDGVGVEASELDLELKLSELELSSASAHSELISDILRSSESESVEPESINV